MRLSTDTLRHILGNPNATTGRKTMDAIITELLALRERVAELERERDQFKCSFMAAEDAAGRECERADAAEASAAELERERDVLKSQNEQMRGWWKILGGWLGVSGGAESPIEPYADALGKLRAASLTAEEWNSVRALVEASGAVASKPNYASGCGRCGNSPPFPPEIPDNVTWHKPDCDVRRMAAALPAVVALLERKGREVTHG